MFDRLIVASSDEERRDSWFMLAEMLRDELGLEEANVDVIAHSHCLGVEKLRRQNLQSRDLIMLEADLEPGNGGVAADAVSLVDRLQGSLRPPCCILIGGGLNIMLKTRHWPLCEHLPCENPAESLLLESLGQLAQGLAAKRDEVPDAPAATGKKWALLDVHLEEKPFFSLRIGTGNRIEDQEDHSFFDVDPVELKGIVDDSRTLRDRISQRLRRPDLWQPYVETWQSDYAEVGKRVFKLINKDDFPFFWGRAFQAAKENIRLRFTLDEESYDGLWESMYDQNRRENEKWLMLKGTVARRARVGENSEVRPLDGKDGAIHVLAIASNVARGSTIEGPNAQFDNTIDAMIESIRESLPVDFDVTDLFEDLAIDLDREMKALGALSAGRSNEAGRPRLVIDFLDAIDERPLRDLVEEKLTGGGMNGACRYDVVHFAGHALFEDVGGARQRGYLIFGNHAAETHAVPISEFAGWLNEANVQLAYLNCCRSSATRAAHELANSKVPLSIGFTWDLDGGGAVDFATTFYRHLLNNDAKVCPAFQYARKRLHRRHQGGDPIWTAPVLVAQPAEWDKVETCFTRH